MHDPIALLGYNTLAREGLRLLLESRDFRVVSSAAAPEQIALDGCDVDGETIVLIDAGANRPAPEIVERVRELYPAAVKIVVLAERFEIDFMADCFERGAVGYLVKEMPWEPLLVSLQLIALGEKVMPSDLADAITTDRSRPQLDDEDNLDGASLSAREREVLRQLTDGCSNKVISRALDISEATVKAHVKAILRKLGVSNRTQAALWAKTRR